MTETTPPGKDVFFEELYALSEGSDPEVDTNEALEFLKKTKPSPNIFSDTAQTSLLSSRVRTPLIKKIPGMRRTQSEPTSSDSVIKETPRIPGKNSLLRTTITPVPNEISLIEETPLPQPLLPKPVLSLPEPSTSNRPTERRTASTPTIGSLVLTNSTGIYSMLGKRKRNTAERGGKKKAKEKAIKPVAESDQVLQGLKFYYLPNNDYNPVRKRRICRARENGATWEKQFSGSVTHIIVDSDHTSKYVMEHFSLDHLPTDVIIVNDVYPLDCITERCLLDPNLIQYTIQSQTITTQEAGLSAASQKSNSIPQANEVRAEFGGDKFLQRSPGSTQASPSKTISQLLATYPSLNENASTNAGYTGPSDALQAMIKSAKSYKDLPPLDEFDEDEVAPSSFNDAIESSDESGNEKLSSRTRNVSKSKKSKNDIAHRRTFNQDNFSCMKGGTGTSTTNANARIIEILEKMGDYYERMKDKWRTSAYRKAVGTLRSQKVKIRTFDEAVILPFIGERLALKIEEIARTNRLRRLESTESEPGDESLQLFMNIYGVALVQASKWVQQGYRTLEDLKSKAQLTENQRLGIEHYHDLLQRIPRDEVTTLGDIVKEAAAAIDSEVQIIIGGSYRRGAATSGDIDCLMTKPGTSSSSELLSFLRTLVGRLRDTGFLVTALASPHSKTGSKWHGCCILPGSAKPIWRRIDFLVVPETEYGAALIYFTGDDIFNRSMRLLASRFNMRLNQKGLYKNGWVRHGGFSFSPFCRAYAPVLATHTNPTPIPPQLFLHFLDGLNAAVLATPGYQAVNAFSTALSHAPFPLFPLRIAGSGLAAGTGAASNASSRTRMNAYLATANQEVFKPRGLRVRVLKTERMMAAVGCREGGLDVR
ncbi:hypothetical protein B7494_g2148, partial [Chlorociboria aeruginascens]